MAENYLPHMSVVTRIKILVIDPSRCPQRPSHTTLIIVTFTEHLHCAQLGSEHVSVCELPLSLQQCHEVGKEPGASHCSRGALQLAGSGEPRIWLLENRAPFPGAWRQL